MPGDEIAFSLPVFGLPGLGEAAPAVDGSAAVPLRMAVTSWPDCAAAVPEITTVPAKPEQAAGLEPGTWYVRTFDFQCVEIVVEGDRNLPDSAAVGNQAREVGESGSIVIEHFDENAEAEIDAQGETVPTRGDAAPALPDKGMPVIAYTRGNLTYSFTVVCSADDSRAFCDDEQGLRELVQQFTVIAGQPQ
ncbi:hypothetical protein [Mesorhizobium sp.]|uniref:hypothetical protein n=1 Tax=Mesorhizobium sp. TaxID=1871066 RepID=UPI000FE4DB69|nr:hypothetical protein [Mesorhizobium sp.]RWN27583.1 MAG: hypothetical protein EOR95_24290 [Mesorhizobium sp.]